jgi:hypothetical protein
LEIIIYTNYYAGKFSNLCSTVSVEKEQKAAVALASAMAHDIFIVTRQFNGKWGF